MNAIVLLAFLFLPRLGACNAQWLKLAILAAWVVGCLKCRRLQWGIGHWCLFGVLVVGFISSWPGGYTSMVGNWEWSQGWLSWVVVAAAGYCWWLSDMDGADEGKEFDQRIGSLAVVSFVASITTAVILAVWGWEPMRVTIATKLGAGVLAGVFMVLQFGRWLSSGNKLWWPGILSAGWVLVMSECRSAVGGAVLGCLCQGSFSWWRFQSGDKLKSKLGQIALICVLIAAASVCVPELRTKFGHVRISTVGEGPRAQMLGQFWEAGVPLFGWGCESQRNLINDSELLGGDTSGIYDRFHCLPVDLLAQFGWFGAFFAVPVLILVVGRYFRCNWDPNVRILFGGLVCFGVASAFNPPAVLSLGIASILVGGLLWDWDRKSLPGWMTAVARGPCAVAAVIFGCAYLGDMLNLRALQGSGDRLPHRTLGMQWIAQQLYPHAKREYVMAYISLYGAKEFTEPRGGKAMLIELLRQEHRRPELEALFWAAFGNQERAAVRAADKRK